MEEMGVVLSYDVTSKRVTVKVWQTCCSKITRDIARIRASDEKGFTLALPETGN